jgi:hypothetical protein
MSPTSLLHEWLRRGLPVTRPSYGWPWKKRSRPSRRDALWRSDPQEPSCLPLQPNPPPAIPSATPSSATSHSTSGPAPTRQHPRALESLRQEPRQPRRGPHR